MSAPSAQPYQSMAVTQKGVSLVELMISITLGLVIMAGVLQLFASSTRSALTAEGASRIQESVRYAIKRIGDDIAKAGNFGCFSFSSSPDEYIQNGLGAANIVANGDNAGSWNDFATSFVSGAANDNADADVLDGTDTLVIKYADQASPIQVTDTSVANQLVVASGDASGINNNDLIMAGNCQQMSVYTVSSDGDDTLTLQNGATQQLRVNKSPAFIYADDTGAHRYYIGSSAGVVCSGAAPENCSLFRQTNGGAGQEIVRGVHGLDVRYSVNGLAFNEDASANYEGIDRIQVTLQFNAVESAGNTLTKTVTRVFGIRNQL